MLIVLMACLWCGWWKNQAQKLPRMTKWRNNLYRARHKREVERKLGSFKRYTTKTKKRYILNRAIDRKCIWGVKTHLKADPWLLHISFWGTTRMDWGRFAVPFKLLSKWSPLILCQALAACVSWKLEWELCLSVRSYKVKGLYHGVLFCFPSLVWERDVRLSYQRRTNESEISNSKTSLTFIHPKRLF